LKWAGRTKILIKQLPKNIFTNITSQRTLLQGVWHCNILVEIKSTSSKVCDQGNLGLSFVGKVTSLVIIYHKGFQSHFIASIFNALAISNYFNSLATKANLCCRRCSLCSFFA
jgi:hypothetical protein